MDRGAAQATQPWPLPHGTRRLRPPVSPSSAAFTSWRDAATRRLADLLALRPDRTDGTLSTTPDLHRDGEPTEVTLITDDAEIPCLLLTPPASRRRDSAVVAVAGHGGGIDDLITSASGAEDYPGGLARKLVRAGFTVLCPEMISFGRRRSSPPDSSSPEASTCPVDATRGLLTGRPVLGSRVTDTLAAVRALRALDHVDPTKIAIAGGSGGGAVTLLAAAVDDHVAAAVVGTYLSSFADSLGAIPHCSCNAVPDLLTWFEMADVATMIAPRPLIIEAGRQDPIFPIAATRTAYAELLDAWPSGSAPPELVITDAGHRFLADDSITLLGQRLARPLIPATGE